MSILNIVFVKALIVRLFHAFSGNKKPGHHSRGYHHEQEYYYIFSKVIFELLWNSPTQWILHIKSPFRSNIILLPVKISRRYLVLVDYVASYHSIPEFYCSVRHVLDGIIVGYHDYGVAVLLIDILYQLEYLLGGIVV